MSRALNGRQLSFIMQVTANTARPGEVENSLFCIWNTENTDSYGKATLKYIPVLYNYFNNIVAHVCGSETDI